MLHAPVTGPRAAPPSSLAARLFPGAGEMATRCRAHDWAATPLGPVEAWPAALRTAAQLVLAAGLPNIVLWGPELIQLYNDSYARIIRAKHPLALGRGNREVWPEVWHLNGPIYERVFAGETVTVEDAYYPLLREAPAGGAPVHGTPGAPTGGADGGWTEADAYLTISFSPIRDESGAVAGVLANMLETTREVERRRLAAEVDAARAQTAAVLERMADAYFLLDADWRVVALNAAMARDTGLPREQLLGRDLWTVFPHAVGSAFEREYRRLALAGEGEAHFTHDYSDGRLDLVVDVDAYATPGPDGRPGVAVFWRDVTARTQAQAALRASEARQAFLLRLADALRAEPDADAVATRALGMLADELRLDRCYVGVYRLAEDRGEFPYQVGNARVPPVPDGVRLSDFPDALRVAFDRTLVIDDVQDAGAPHGLSDVDRRNLGALGLRALVAATLRGADPSAEHRGEQGAERAPLWAIVAVSADPRRWTPGEVALVEEVTERTWAAMERARAEARARGALAAAEAARAEAEAANRAKSEFLAVMSHELRTPLNAIGGYAELIELGIHGPVTAAQRTALERIQRSQRHLLGLIAGVLDYSRVEAGAVTYRLADVPVAEAVAEAELLVAPQLRAKGLGYAWSGAAPGAGGRPLCVRADREKLQQILLNLLGNAVKFTDARGGVPGRIEVACEMAGAADPAGGRVRLHVRDTGDGIAPEALERVFEPFVQADQRLTRAHAGVGLGLAISRDLARGMGGDLTAESAPGVGSTFTLTLPVA